MGEFKGREIHDHGSVIEWSLEYLQSNARAAGYEPKISRYTEIMQEQFLALRNTNEFITFIGAKELLNNPEVLALRLPSNNSLVLIWHNPTSDLMKQLAAQMIKEMAKGKV